MSDKSVKCYFQTFKGINDLNALNESSKQVKRYFCCICRNGCSDVEMTFFLHKWRKI